MDNQKDQSGTTPDQTNAGRSTNSNGPTASGASAASRKSAPMPNDSENTSTPAAQSAASSPSAQSQSTANAGGNRQGEGQQANASEGTLLDTALNSGKKWIEDSGVLNNVNQLPQALKDLGNRAAARVSDLSTTQKVVGGAILAVGLGWLATRKGKSSSDSSDSSAYNYGRQRDAGSYGRRSSSYQAPDASTSGRTDSGSPYGNSGNRFGSSGNYNTGASSASNTGSYSGSNRDESGAAHGGASARTDHGSQLPTSDYSAKSTDYRSIE